MKTISHPYLINSTGVSGVVLLLPLTVLLTYPAMADQSNRQLGQPVSHADTALQVSQAEKGSKAVSQNQVKPTAQSALSSRDTVGLVKSFSGKTLELWLADGTCRTFTVEPEVLGALNPQRGTLVALDTSNNGSVTGLQLVEVDRTIHGDVTSIIDDQVTLRLPNNQTETTRVSPETAARIGLAPGVPLSVTSYRGTASTRVCVRKQVRTPPPVTPPPIRALW